MNPSLQYVKVGESASFKCESDKDSEWHYYSELKHFQGLPKNSKLIGNRVLHIKKIKESNRGMYECEGWAKKNNDSTEYYPFSAKGVLKVISKLQCVVA